MHKSKKCQVKKISIKSVIIPLKKMSKPWAKLIAIALINQQTPNKFEYNNAIFKLSSGIYFTFVFISLSINFYIHNKFAPNDTSYIKSNPKILKRVIGITCITVRKLQKKMKFLN